MPFRPSLVRGASPRNAPLTPLHHPAEGSHVTMRDSDPARRRRAFAATSARRRFRRSSFELRVSAVPGHRPNAPPPCVHESSLPPPSPCLCRHVCASPVPPFEFRISSFGSSRPPATAVKPSGFRPIASPPLLTRCSESPLPLPKPPNSSSHRWHEHPARPCPHHEWPAPGRDPWFAPALDCLLK